jgi:RNA polymerase primary sigma factor
MNLSNLKGGTGIIANPADEKILKKYYSEISALKPLTKEEEIELFKKIAYGDEKAFEKIYKHNLLFVVSVARKYSSAIKSNSMSLEDLISEGNIGLYYAIKKFDYTKGYKFISFAVWSIKNQILESIKDNLKTVKIPTNVRNEYQIIKKEEHKLEQKFGRHFEPVELYEMLLQNGTLKESCTFSRYSDIFNSNTYCSSLNLKNEDEDVELIDLLKSDDELSDDNDERKLKVEKLLSKLKKVDAEIIKKFFGIDTEEVSINKLSEEYGITKQALYTKINKNLSYLLRQSIKTEKYINNIKIDMSAFFEDNVDKTKNNKDYNYRYNELIL